MTFHLHHGDAYEFAKSQADDAFDLTFTSPPYEGQRRYKNRFRLTRQKWVDWLAPIIVECARATKGLVIVNMASPVKDGSYTAAVEWLVTDLTRVHGLACGPAPYAWTKNGVPGSGADRYHRRDWEPLYTFARPEKLKGLWSDPLEFGAPPKYRPGGAMTNRNAKGERKANGKRPENYGSVKGGRGFAIRNNGGFEPNASARTFPIIANPGNVIHANVGKGHMGSMLAHDSDAPMPLALAERFVGWYCRPGGTVFDPFTGSGTTGEAALIHGRRFVGCDVNDSEGGIETARHRLKNVVPSLFRGADCPHKGVSA